MSNREITKTEYKKVEKIVSIITCDCCGKEGSAYILPPKHLAILLSGWGRFSVNRERGSFGTTVLDICPDCIVSKGLDKT